MNNQIQKNRSYLSKILLLLIFSLGWNLWTLKSLLKAKFGLIDDHEIVNFLGRDRDLGLSEIVGLTLNSTEVGEWGESKRFRPTYYIFRLIQTAIFGNSAENFYLYRILVMSMTATLVGVFAICIAKSLHVKMSMATAILWTFLACLLPVWADVVTRLGPSELEQSFFYIVSLILLWLALSRLENTIYWLALAVVIILSSGLKENMAIILVVTLLGIIYSRSWLDVSKKVTLAYIFTGIIVTLIELGPVIAINQNDGTDIYGQNRGLIEILQLLIQATISPHILICLVFTIVVIRLNHKKTAKIPKNIRFLLISMNLILISEYVFYAGNVRGNRYSMITQVTLLIYLIIGTSLVNRLLTQDMKIRFNYFTPEAVVAVISLAVLLSPAFATKNSLNIYASAKNSRIQTQTFQKKMDYAIMASKKENYIKFVAQSSWDYEAIYSSIVFLDNASTDLHFFLDVTAPQENNVLGSMLLKNLKLKSVYGDENWRISPLGNASNKQKFTCIFFDLVDSTSPNCSTIRVVNSH